MEDSRPETLRFQRNCARRRPQTYTIANGIAMSLRTKKSPPPAVVLTARIPKDVKAALDKAAREDARTTSSLVAKILMDWLAGRK
jgi:hypothetical protein